jgi:glutamate-1-semialdehyde 2,1-aminomutase
MNRSCSSDLYHGSLQLIPGGVNSPVRAFKGVGGHPIFIAKAKGSRFEDVDGNSYLDYVGSWGTAILGHSHPEVVEAVQKACVDGLSFGAPTVGELALASLLTGALPSLEKVRLVSSGTEACMSVIRLARGFTGRKKILKFTGHYHGHGDSLLVKAGSGVATFSLPNSPGVLEEVAAQTLVAPFNDIKALTEIGDLYGSELAAVILEPIAGNCGFIPPNPGFLEALRAMTTKVGALLIFDEVMTGFRVAWGGYQNRTSVVPDLTTLGKVIGGGMPLAAFGGRRDIMDALAPQGPIYQAGTLSGNPVAVAAGLKTLEILQRPGAYDALAQSTDRLVSGLWDLAQKEGLPLQAQGLCGMFGVFFSKDPVTSYEEALKSDVPSFNQFFHRMLDLGVYLAPSAFEAGFVSLAHSPEDISWTLDQARSALIKS